MSEPMLLFVYGSLRVGFREPSYSYLSRFFTFLGEATAEGRFFFNGSFPVAVPSTDGHMLTGDVYALNDPAEYKWVMMQLDDYEGLNVEEGETPIYRRDKITVNLNGSHTDAWVYWYNRSVENMPALDANELAAYMEKQKKS